MKNSMKVALCGILTALSAVVMFLSGVIPAATVALPALAGCLLIPVVAELGMAWGFGSYAACGLLSLLLVPDREAVLLYLLFFGYYPVLFALLGKIPNRALRYGVKLVLFNCAVFADTALTVFVLGIPWENIPFLGNATPVVLLLMANLVFVLYDRALGGLIFQYFSRLHGSVRRLLQGK